MAVKARRLSTWVSALSITFFVGGRNNSAVFCRTVQTKGKGDRADALPLLDEGRSNAQQRDLSICFNNTSVPRATVDAAVLTTVETAVLRPHVIQGAVEAAMNQLLWTVDSEASRRLISEARNERLKTDIAAPRRGLAIAP